MCFGVIIVSILHLSENSGTVCQYSSSAISFYKRHPQGFAVYRGEFKCTIPKDFVNFCVFYRQESACNSNGFSALFHRNV